MSVTLDEEGCVYVQVAANRGLVRSEPVAPGVVIDYDYDGEMLGVEVIAPRGANDG